MSFYKVFYNNELKGIGSSQNFLFYQKAHNILLVSNEQVGEYFQLKTGELVRDTWLQPVKNLEIKYIMGSIVEISANEYYQLEELLQSGEVIQSEPSENIKEETQPIENVDISEDEITLEAAKDSKINKLKKECSNAIERGFDLVLDNVTYHFSLTLEDQINLNSISIEILQGKESFIYHADNELNKTYSKEEMQLIINTAAEFKQMHLDYFNTIKSYINSLDSLEQIVSIEYNP